MFERLKANKIIDEITNTKTITQLRKFIVTGLLSFVIEYTLFLVLYSISKVWYVAANLIVYFVVFWFNFLLNRIWTFNAKHNFKRQLTLYASLFFLNLVLTTSLIIFFSDILGVMPEFSKVVVMLIIVPWNFIIYKKFIYKY